MSRSEIDDVVRGLDRARSFVPGPATTAAASELRDAIVGTAVDEDERFDTVEVVLTTCDRRLVRGRAVAAAAVLLVATAAGAITVVVQRATDERPEVATARSTQPSSTEPPSTSGPSTTTTIVPSMTAPVPTTVGAPNPAVTVPVPPSNEPCRGAGAPYDAWGLRTYLVQQVPDGFGGLYGGSTGSLVVNVVAGREATVADAKADFDGRYCTASPATDYETVRNTVVRLEVLKQRMGFAAAQLEAEGVDVNSYGVDDAANRLRVGLANVTGDNEQSVLDALIATRDEVVFEQQDVVSPAI